MCGLLYSWGSRRAGLPVQSIEHKLAAIYATVIASYCGGSAFLDDGIRQKLAGPEKA
jgi:hypothetical protein